MKYVFLSYRIYETNSLIEYARGNSTATLSNAVKDLEELGKQVMATMPGLEIYKDKKLFVHFECINFITFEEYLFLGSK